MKKNKLDMFLEVSFKIGKVLSSIFLVVIFIVAIGCGIGLLKFNFTNVQTPNFATLKQAMKNQESLEENNDNSIETNVSISKYKNKIEVIIQENSLDYAIHESIEKVVMDLPEKYQDQFLNGLDKFYKDGFQYLNLSSDSMRNYLYYAVKQDVGYYNAESEFNRIVNVKANGVYNIHLCTGLLRDYYTMFKRNIQTMEQQAQEDAMTKNILAIVLGGSVLVFVILLFLPVLIKIEENTRPEKHNEENNDNNSENATKECPHCHKQIKINAKKCRFCGEWLDKDGEN